MVKVADCKSLAPLVISSIPLVAEGMPLRVEAPLVAEGLSLRDEAPHVAEGLPLRVDAPELQPQFILAWPLRIDLIGLNNWSYCISLLQQVSKFLPRMLL